MLRIVKACIVAMLLTTGLGCVCGPAAAAVRIDGQAQVGGAPLASSTVTLWAASTGDPVQLAQTKTNADGRFDLRAAERLGLRTLETKNIVLYPIAKGGVATIKRGSGNI